MSEWVIVQTPSGNATLSRAEWQQQVVRVDGVLARANIRGTFSAQSYVARYGEVGPGRNAFGDDVWRGLQMQFRNYPFASRYAGYPMHLGWFLLPEPFSRAGAATAPSQRELLHPRWYPAVFGGYVTDGALQMSCLNIVVMGSRPWWVHRDRAVLLTELFFELRALPAWSTAWLGGLRRYGIRAGFCALVIDRVVPCPLLMVDWWASYRRSLASRPECQEVYPLA